jgi:hypothetical protein
MSSNPAASKACAHPCLRGDPLPASVEQPDLTVNIRYFTVTLEKLVSDYPYEISPSQGKVPHIQLYHIPYCEISGRGPPPADMTGSSLGDIYIDLSPDQYAAYGKVVDDVWKRWYDPQPAHRTEDLLVKHPHFRNRMLWCSDCKGKGISWFVSTTVSGHQERAKAKGLVSLDVEKTEETRGREAAAIIGEWMSGQEIIAGSRSTSPLSPPLESRESSPLLVLGKRKTRDHEERSAAKRYKALLRRLIQQLRHEKDELAEEICVLEKHFESNPQDPQLSVADPKQFSEWMEKVIVGMYYFPSRSIVSLTMF